MNQCKITINIGFHWPNREKLSQNILIRTKRLITMPRLHLNLYDDNKPNTNWKYKTTLNPLGLLIVHKIQNLF